MVTIDSRIVWAAINFLILLWLLKRFLFKPITEMLDKRSQKIKDDLNSAAQREKEAEDLKEKYDAELRSAREKAQEIIEDAEKRGKEQAEVIVEEAKAEAVVLKERNFQEIEQAKEDAYNELSKEITNISLMVASKFMQQKLEKEQHEQLIEQFIDSLNKRKLGEMK